MTRRKSNSLKGLVAAGLLSLLASGPIHAQVVFNELSTGVDWIEITNLGSSSVDISGWIVCAFHTTVTTPITFVFPGTAQSGTVMIAPDESVIVSDHAVDPIVASGVQRFTTSPVNLFPFQASLWGSAVLCDAAGNGIDYLAWGNPNTLGAPFQVATMLGIASNQNPTSTSWSGAASPRFSSIGRPNDRDLHFRHTRADTDSAADWSMISPMSGTVANATPGALNRFQVPSGPSLPSPTAAFEVSTTLGIAPLEVYLANRSTGIAELTSVQWDFDAAGYPGQWTSTAHNAACSYNPTSTTTYQITLTILDALGNFVAAPPQSVTVNVVPPVAPVANVPFIERFDGPISSNLTRADPLSGWEFRSHAFGSQLRTTNPATLTNVALNYAPATQYSGANVAIVDSAVGTSTSELILHFDLLALGGSCRVRYRIYSNADDPSPEDVVFLQDGITAGDGVQNGGGTTGVPGLDGFKEVHLASWNASPITRIWTRYEHVIDAAYLASAGIVATNDMRLAFRQNDNQPFEGSDGLLIDDVEILRLPIPGPGQAAVPGAALLDVNQSRNANGSTVGEPMDLAGPFFVDVVTGSPITFRFAGEPNQAIVVLTGPINPPVASYSGIGQLDIGVPNPAGFPTGLTVLADGYGPTFLDFLFRTTSSGEQLLSFSANGLVPGTTIPIQTFLYNSTTVVRLSNTVVINVL